MPSIVWRFHGVALCARPAAWCGLVHGRESSGRAAKLDFDAACRERCVRSSAAWWREIRSRTSRKNMENENNQQKYRSIWRHGRGIGRAHERLSCFLGKKVGIQTCHKNAVSVRIPQHANLYLIGRLGCKIFATAWNLLCSSCSVPSSRRLFYRQLDQHTKPGYLTYRRGHSFESRSVAVESVQLMYMREIGRTLATAGS